MLLIPAKVEEGASMSSKITSINLGGVNCYLLKSDQGFVLIDTGFQTQRAKLEQRLDEAGCKPGNLKLIILTHGDTDHVGNCAYLHQKYGAPCAIHAKDAPMVEDGNMGANRKAKPDELSLIFRILGLFTRRLAERHPLEKFKPDFTVDEAFDLGVYGLKASVVHLPGHSKGSIGVLTSEGALFCGDMFYNVPGFRCTDDLSDHEASLKKLRGLKIERVYPGHGKPFSAGAVLARAR